MAIHKFTETSFYDIKSGQPIFQDALQGLKAADFIAWDSSFLDFIGPNAKLERIQSFENELPTVHEAPAYVPETNELFFADTQVTGWLWAIEIDTHQVYLLSLEDGERLDKILI